jgi:hypothetical protein
MILSKKHNFIFLKTSKTAGTSFEIALSKFLGDDDIITPISPEDEVLRAGLGFRGPQNHFSGWRGVLHAAGARSLRPTFYNHIPARDLLALVGRPLFSGYKKASIVRNPYDMAVSLFFWQHREQPDMAADHFRPWLLSKPTGLFKNRTITHIQDAPVVDFMIRFEAFEEDIQTFAALVGLPASLSSDFASIRAKSQHRPKRASTARMFEGFDAGRALIEDIFKDDIRTYGYACPQPQAGQMQ